METIEHIKKETASILTSHDVEEAYVFGSTARGEAREDSDVDILVRFKKLKGLFDFMKVKFDLQEALGGRTVDLVQIEAVRPEYRESIDMQKVRII